jgi:hypothetical protein
MKRETATASARVGRLPARFATRAGDWVFVDLPVRFFFAAMCILSGGFERRLREKRVGVDLDLIIDAEHAGRALGGIVYEAPSRPRAYFPAQECAAVLDRDVHAGGLASSAML